MSLQEVVRTVHMKLDLAKLQHRLVDILITDLAKFFNVIAHGIHPIVGARVGQVKARHLATHLEGFSYTLPLGPWQSSTVTQLLGTPQGTIQGVHSGARAAFPFLQFLDIACKALAVSLPGAHVGGRHDHPTGTGRRPPYTGRPGGSSDVLRGYLAGRCPGPQNPARIDFRSPAPTIAHSRSGGPDMWAKRGQRIARSNGRRRWPGPRRSSPPGFSDIWGRTSTSRAHPRPPVTYRRSGRRCGSNSAPSDSPQTRP